MVTEAQSSARLTTSPLTPTAANLFIRRSGRSLGGLEWIRRRSPGNPVSSPRSRRVGGRSKEATSLRFPLLISDRYAAIRYRRLKRQKRYGPGGPSRAGAV